MAFSLAACGPQQPLAIEHAQFNPPLGSTGIGAAYFTIRSAQADRIVAVSSSLADAVEIHASVTKGNRVSMQRLETVELPAGQTVRFEPGGMHLMVFSPRSEASAKAFPITIELQSGTKEIVSFEKVAGGSNRPS
jgi:copper(I)-binding protein